MSSGGLKGSARRGAAAAAVAERRRRRTTCRASSPGLVFPMCLHVEATLLSVEFCKQAKQALHLASMVMYCASYRLGHPSEISVHTMEQTIRMCTPTFVKTAEDAYHKKAKKATIRSFLDSLGDLVAISHILFVNTLDTANDMLLGDGKPKHNPNVDVEATRREFELKLSHLKQNVEAKDLLFKSCKILEQIVCPATVHASKLVTMMVSLRWDVLKKAPRR